jgi:hypothetical protein
MTDLSAKTPLASAGGTEVIPVLKDGAYEALEVSKILANSAADATTKANAAQAAAIAAAASDATTKADAALASALLNLGTGRVPYNPGSGAHVSFPLVSTSGGSYSGVNNRVCLIPFIAPFTFTSDRILCYCGTGVASAAAKILVYASDSNGRPTTKLLETANLDCSTQGEKNEAYSQQFVKGTLYYLGLWTTGTASFTAVTNANCMDLSHTFSAGISITKVFRRTKSYSASANQADSPWAWNGAEASAESNIPVIWLRIA